MRYRFLFIIFLFFAINSYGQNIPISKKGTVSYISSQNVYVKFESTENIEIGDTLFISKGDQLVPVLVIDNKSSISCVCSPVSSARVQISDVLIFQKREVNKLDKAIEEKLFEEKKLAQNGGDPSTSDQRPRFSTGQSGASRNSNKKPDRSRVQDILSDQDDVDEFKERMNGRVSVTSYNAMSGERKTNTIRYALSFRGEHLGNSRFSVENYITFRHTIHEWDEVKDNLSSALKVYSFAAKYDFSKKSSITLGRKINPRISSMGAIDGLQAEVGVGNFTLGAIAGSRPGYMDYGFNIHLPQFGAYLSHESNNNNRFMQTTLAFIEQRNNNKTDRRFLYFQHSESLLKDLFLFTSIEMSLFENIDDVPKTVFSLNNLYLMLRYRLSRKWSFSASYDNRKNIIYYESYKNFIDQLIEDETRQGLRFHLNYHPFKNITWGVNTGWRFQKSGMNTSQNLNTYLTFSRITSLNIMTSLSADFLRTGYLNSRIFGIRISKDIVPGKLNADINYRNVNYQFLNYETSTRQNIFGVNLSLRIFNKLSFYTYYEGIFDDMNQVYNRLNVKIVQRF